MPPARWVVIFRDRPQMLDVREKKELRDAHVARAKDHPELLIGVSLKTREDQNFCSTLWVMEAEGRIVVEHLASNDPFYSPEIWTFELVTW